MAVRLHFYNSNYYSFDNSLKQRRKLLTKAEEDVCLLWKISRLINEFIAAASVSGIYLELI